MSEAFALDATVERFKPGEDYAGSHSRTPTFWGVLMNFTMPRPTGQPPTAKLSLLETNLKIPHSEMLFWSQYPYAKPGMPEQPVMSVPMGDLTVRVASRYMRTSSILLLDVMSDTTKLTRRRQIHPYHETVRRTVALACARAILEPLPDNEHTTIMLNSILNFEHPHYKINRPAVAIRGLSEFALVMSCEDLPQPPSEPS